MTDYKEIIKNLTKEDYRENRVNLHIHSTYSDGSGDFCDLIKQAGEKNYKYIAISDHNTLNGYLENKVPEFVIPAVEFDVWCGYVFLHLLGYGMYTMRNYNLFVRNLNGKPNGISLEYFQNVT